ncbi:MAG: hypothetical protein J6O49_14260, partial [Bacteroidaceae bacterium]|nr:hypothetical protein [Bacteroidaceae bacterium]
SIYEGAPAHVVNAAREAQAWLLQEFGQDIADKIADTVYFKYNSYGRESAAVETGKLHNKGIRVNRESEIDTEVMIHENIHSVTNNIIGNYSIMEKELRKSFNTARKEIYKAAGITANKDNDRKYVSRYGSTDSGEFLSEAIAKYYAGKRNPVTTAAVEYIKKRIKK